MLSRNRKKSKCKIDVYIYVSHVMNNPNNKIKKKIEIVFRSECPENNISHHFIVILNLYSLPIFRIKKNIKPQNNEKVGKKKFDEESPERKARTVFVGNVALTVSKKVHFFFSIIMPYSSSFFFNLWTFVFFFWNLKD